MTRYIFVVAVAWASPIAGCKDEPRKPSENPLASATEAAAPTAADLSTAKEMFAMRCTPCHGLGGAGDGPASAGLTPKPANFTSSDWQKSVTDGHVRKIIVYGGLAVGKGAAMPPNPDLDAKPNIVAALAAHIRSLRK